MKKKILFIISFSFILFLLLFNKSYASTENISTANEYPVYFYLNNITYVGTINKELNNYAVIHQDGKVILLDTTNDGFYFQFAQSRCYFWAGLTDEGGVTGRLTCDIYIYDFNSATFNFNATYMWTDLLNGYSKISLANTNSFVYIVDDAYNNNEKGLLGDVNNFLNLEIGYFEEGFCQINTYFFDNSFKDKIICYISSDDENYSPMILGESFDRFNYYYDVYKNGTYYIKLENKETGEIQKRELIIDKIDESITSLNLHLSTTEQTTEPIYILSNKYYYTGDYDASQDFLNNYDIDIAYGLDSPYQFSPFSMSGEDENGKYRQYQYKIVTNGIYKARVLDFNTAEISYETFNVSNIGVSNKYGEDVYYNNYNDKGEFDPTPVLFLDYIDVNTVRIRTQPFIFNEFINLECYFSQDGENYEKISNIYKYSVDTSNSSYDYNTGEKQNILDLYYFYQDVNLDGTYHFKFYNITLKKYTVASINVNIKEFVTNNIDKIDKFSDKMYIWGQAHFGILLYPLDFIKSLFSRVSTINYNEPVIHIPELKDPINKYTLLEATDFNFNNTINNNIVRNIYNIYLIAVDAVLIFLYIKLCGRVFKEVFGGD